LFEEISENLDLYIETEKEGIRKNLHFCLPKREEEIIAKNIKDEIRTQIEAVYIQKTLRSIPLADISEIKYMAEEQCRRKIQEVLEMA
jgi:lauroyl/myristoyl acyltransferase